MNCLIVGKDMEPDPWAKSEFFAWNDGRRIVDMGELAKQLHCKQCSSLLDLQRTEGETRYGFASILHIHCSCGLLNDVHTAIVKNGDEKSRKNSPTFDINVKASINLLMYGVGSHILSFLTLLDIPVPNPDDACLTVPITSDTATSHVPPTLPSATTSIKSAVTASDTSMSAQPTSAVSQTAQSFQTSLPLLSSSDLSVSSVPEVFSSVNNDGGDAVQAVDSDRVVISNVDHPHNNRLGKAVSDEEEDDNGDECLNDEDDDYVPPAELKLRLKPKPAPSPPKRRTSRKSKNTRAKSAAKTKRVTPRRTVKLKIKVKDVITENDVKLAEESDGDKEEEEKEDTGIERNSKDFDNLMEWSSTESEQESSREKESTSSQLEEEQQFKDEEEAKLGRKRGRPRGSTDRGKRARKSEARIQKEAVPPETQGAAGETKEFPTCKLCAKDFNSIKGYNVHMKRVHNQDMKEKVDPIIYVCSLCKQPFARDYSVISHLEKKHWTPDLDPKDSYVSIPLKEVILRVPQNTASPAGRGRDCHRKTHLCLLCGQSSMPQDLAARHICVDTDGRLTCVASCPAGLRLAHMQRCLLFSSRLGHLCDHCGSIFSHKASFDMHLLNAHGQASKRSETYKCRTCGHSFGHSSALRSHENTHEAGHSHCHVCDLCGKGFKTPESLRVHHGKIHQRSEKYRCQYCSKSYYSKSLWKTHIQQHLGTSPFHCSVCNQGFSSNYCLSVHRRIHTGEKPYKCQHCDAAFAQKNSLNVHMKKHQKLGSQQIWDNKGLSVLSVSVTESRRLSPPVKSRVVSSGESGVWDSSVTVGGLDHQCLASTHVQ